MDISKQYVPKQCTTCAHFAVCKLFEDRRKLEEKTKDLGNLLEFNSFTIKVSCRNYLTDSQQSHG